MLHNTETLIADLLGSIPTVPNIATMEKAEDDAASRAQTEVGLETGRY